jgi:hypothetical protein
LRDSRSPGELLIRHHLGRHSLETTSYLFRTNVSKTFETVTILAHFLPPISPKSQFRLCFVRLEPSVFYGADPRPTLTFRSRTVPLDSAPSL